MSDKRHGWLLIDGEPPVEVEDVVGSDTMDCDDKYWYGYRELHVKGLLALEDD